MRRFPAVFSPLVHLCLLATLLSAERGVASDLEQTLSDKERTWLRTVQAGLKSYEWDLAVESLRFGSDAALEALSREVPRHVESAIAARQKAMERLAALTSGARTGQKREKILSMWQETYRHANEFLFDKERFPYPPGGRVNGPYIGYAEARKRGDAAIKAFQVASTQFRGALRPVLKLRIAEAKKRGGEWRAVEERCDRVGKACDYVSLDAPELTDPVSEDVAYGLLLLELRAGDLDRVDHRVEKLPTEWRKALAWMVYCETILEWNKKNSCEMGKMAVRGLVRLNDYRMALGIHPMWHSVTLGKVAQGHSTEMLEMGYFGHVSPVEANKDPERRARNEGYPGRVTECCSGGSDPSSSVEAWKWDGGHHRGMIDPEWREVGISWKGPCTLNPGAGTKETAPAIRMK